MYEVLFGTTVSSKIVQFESKSEAHKEAKSFVMSYLTPGAKKAGESFVKIDSNTYAIKHIAGGHPVIASVNKVK